MSTRREFLRKATVTAASAEALSGLLRGGAATPNSDKIIRIAVVGGGFGSRFQWQEHPNCKVVAATDLYASRR